MGPQVSWFLCETSSVLVLVWVQYYTDFSIGGRYMDRWVDGELRLALLLFDLPRKCLGFNVGPPSILDLVWESKCLIFSVGSLMYWF